MHRVVLQLAPARKRTPDELVWCAKHCQTSRFTQAAARAPSNTPSFETPPAAHQNVNGIHAGPLQIHHFECIQISFTLSARLLQA